MPAPEFATRRADEINETRIVPRVRKNFANGMAIAQLFLHKSSEPDSSIRFSFIRCLVFAQCEQIPLAVHFLG